MWPWSNSSADSSSGWPPPPAIVSAETPKSSVLPLPAVSGNQGH